MYFSTYNREHIQTQKKMQDGMYSLDVTANGTVTKGIALVENDKVKWFSWSGAYRVERSKKGAKTQWFVIEQQPNKQTPGLLKRGEFPAKLEGTEGENWFSLKGASRGDANAKISIQGKRLRDLPF